MRISAEEKEMINLQPSSKLQASPGARICSGLHNILNTSIISVDICNISLLEDGDGLLIIDKILVISLDSAAEIFFGRIICAIDIAEVVINSDNIHFVTDESSQQILRYPIKPNLFIPTFTILFLECDWHGPKWCSYMSNTTGTYSEPYHF